MKDACSMLGVLVNEKDKALCPFHPDKNPSMHIYDDGYKCYSCGAKGDIFDLAQKIKNTDIKGAIQFYGGGDNNNRQSSPFVPKIDSQSSLSIKKQSPTINIDFVAHIKSCKKRLVDNPKLKKPLYQFNISDDVIKYQNIGLTKDNKYTLPIKKGDDFVDIRVWDVVGVDSGPKIRSWAKGTGGNNLFPTKSLSNDEIWLCEGEKDTLVALSHGVNAITNTTGVSSWSATEFNHHFEGKIVYIVMDIDEPGKLGAFKRYESLKNIAKEVHIIDLPLDIKKYEKGDLTNYLVDEKKEIQDLKNHIKDLKKITKPKEIKIDTENQTNKKKLSYRELVEPYLADKLILNHADSDTLYEYKDNYWQMKTRRELQVDLYPYIIESSNSASNVNDSNRTFFECENIIKIMTFKKVNHESKTMNFRNGILNLTTLKMEDHSPQKFHTNIIGSDFTPVEANDVNDQIPMFLDFLNVTFQKDQEIINLIQEIMGYILYPDCSQEKAFVFFGEGHNGKTVLGNIICDIVGDQNISVLSYEELKSRFRLIQVENKLLNFSDELETKDRVETDAFKKIVSGQRLTVEQKNQPAYQIKPYVKLLYNANQLPITSDKSFGFFRRFIIIPFTHEVEKKDRVFFLDKKILKKEKNGIINWALLGLKRLRQNQKFTHSEKCENALERYKDESNSVRLFVKEFVTFDQNEKVSCKDFMRFYIEWCNENKYNAFSKHKVSKVLATDFNISAKNGHRTRFYVGLKIESDIDLVDVPYYQGAQND